MTDGLSGKISFINNESLLVVKMIMIACLLLLLHFSFFQASRKLLF